jgi:hypothetical protein
MGGLGAKIFHPIPLSPYHPIIILKEVVMSRIKELKAPSSILPVLEKAGIKLRHFKTAEEFETVLLKFLRKNNILHLGTCKDNLPRTTPLEYRLWGFTFFILSEGGKKFVNLETNKNVSFSIAEPYHPKKDFWGAKGVQAWGKALVYSKKTNPKRFEEALQKMGVYESLKLIGVKELPRQFNYQIIEITPDEIRFGNLRKGIYKTSWLRE